MATKICHSCRSEVDALAKVCPSCRAKLGKPGEGGIAAKPTSLVVGCLAVFLGFGVLGMVIQAIGGGGKPAAQTAVKPAEPVDPKYGIQPDPSLIHMMLSQQIPAGLHDPSSFKDLEVFAPTKDTIKVKGKSVNCWKVVIQFRAKNGFGALRLNRGAVWMRDNNSIKEELGL